MNNGVPSNGSEPPAKKGYDLLLWASGLLLKLLGVPDAPETLRQALAGFIGRSGRLLAFGLTVPLLCALLLNAIDKAGGQRIVDWYRDYVVSGFSINESIYRSDMERIDYLLQMRHINFFEEDEAGGDSSILISVIPGQLGRIVIERADLVLRKRDPALANAGGTQPPAENAAKDPCHQQYSPRLAKVILVISDDRQKGVEKTFWTQVGTQFELDAGFWSDMKIDPAKSIKSLKLSVTPPNIDQTRTCFDLFVDLRVEVFKTRSR